MIRLNEEILNHVTEHSRCPPIGSHLIGIRLLLWPAFAKTMSSHIESLRKINGSSQSGGVFGGKGSSTTVKDNVVQIIVSRYIEMFNAFVSLSIDYDEENVFSR